jgi:hypothetical protein
MNRQKNILFMLLTGLILAGLYAFWSAPRLQQAPAISHVERDQKASAPQKGSEFKVHLQLMSLDRQSYDGYRRNIFAPLHRTTNTTPVATNVAPPPQPPPPSPPPQQEPAAEVELEEDTRRELARFTFMGFLKKDDVKSIFLSSGGEIFVVKSGDRFGREFVVLTLSNENLQIRQGNDSRIINIPLVEQAPLMQARSSGLSSNTRQAVSSRRQFESPRPTATVAPIAVTSDEDGDVSIPSPGEDEEGSQ